MRSIICNIFHSTFFIATDKQTKIMFHRKPQIPYTLHCIQYTDCRSLIVLCPSTNKIFSFPGRSKRRIFPALPNRNNIQMVPESNHIIPVFFTASNTACIIFIIFCIKSMFLTNLKHCFKSGTAFLSNGRDCILRIRYTGYCHNPTNIIYQIFFMFFHPIAYFYIYFLLIHNLQIPPVLLRSDHNMENLCIG